MASRIPGLHRPAWSGDTEHRAAGEYRGHSRERSSSGARSAARKGVPEPGRQTSQPVSQPKMSSRLPSAQSSRRPSEGQPEPPRLNHRPNFRSSVGSPNSLGITGMSGPPSATAASSRLPAPSSVPRTLLRRKHSGLSQNNGAGRIGSHDDSTRSGSSDSNPRSLTPFDASPSLQLDRELTQSPMEIHVAQQIELPRTTAHAVTIYPELDRSRDVKPLRRSTSPGLELPYPIATHDLPPPTPLFSGSSSQLSVFSGSPSTGWSGSPGPGPYSRETTPTSISSQSPGLVAPVRIPAPKTTRFRQAEVAVTRPPVTRRRAGSASNNEAGGGGADPHGLAAVRESLTSSSSNSTVRGGDGDRKQKSRTKRMSPLPPSPPPRQSSQKFKRSRDENAPPPQLPDEAVQPRAASPTPSKATSYARPRPVQASQPVAAPRPAPPRRPSRDGTPDLQSQLGLPIPVIQSNLSPISISERRQSASFLATSPTNQPPLSSSLPERPSYLARRPAAREPTPAPSSAASGDGSSHTAKPDTGRTTRTPSPSVSSFKTRFPIFGRRSKTVPEPTDLQKKDKPARKGPAAGTGHEGYGRLGSARRRSSSITNTARALPGTMSSQESLSNNHWQDPFLMERIAPVVIAGGEVVENRNTSSELSRTESNQSIFFRRPSIESRNSSQVSLSSRDAPRHTLWPSPFPRGVTQVGPLASRRPSESSDSEALAIKPTLALRRSMQRLKPGDPEPPRLPKPIVTRPEVVSPALTSFDTSIMSDDSMFDASREVNLAVKEPAGSTLAVPISMTGPKKLVKRSRSPRKWNFFGRSESQPATVKTETVKPVAATVAATVKPAPARPVAFYTMMDSSEQEDVGTPELEEVFREARTVTTPPLLAVPKAPEAKAPSAAKARDPTPKRTTPASTRSIRSPSVTRQKAAVAPLKAPEPQVIRAQAVPAYASSLVPTPAPLSAPIKTVMPAPTPASTPIPPPTQQAPLPRQTGRPSRLPQVGRIPKVVSARALQASPKSFSRPFHRLSIPSAPDRPAVENANFVAKGPTPPNMVRSDAELERPTSAGNNNMSVLLHGMPQVSPIDQSRLGQEFISFSPRKNSQCTTTSSSSSGGMLTFADATAVVPDPNAPLAEDEIWDEYNDLLGDVTLKLPASQGPSWGEPLRLGSKRDHGRQIEPALESPTLSPPLLPSLDQALHAKPHPSSSIYSVDIDKPHPSSSIYSTDMAEEIKRMLGVTTTPAAVPPLAFREPTEVIVAETQAKKPVGGRLRAGSESRERNMSRARDRRSNSSGSSLASEDNTPQSQLNLRMGSMTVSKWLTFGHVIFSPVRDELIDAVGSLKRPSILVVDGLGNDDWSFYAAETYPTATFFNLSPRGPLPADHQSSTGVPLSPPNHHQVQYTSYMEKFPFGAQSFTAVVFRFPSAGPEAQYRNIISEARRVLKPGGYIELSILDVDLNNMGNRGRRVVRHLKERIHAKAPNTSLGSASDLILRQLGRKGFTDLKTCKVGVPVVSAVPRSSSSEAGNGGRRGSVDIQGRARKDDRSLPELISDESPVADENITKMVAKVGRWWYSKCYESVAAAPPSGHGSRASMWRDKALLAECEEWGTSLKLMVCHARVPDGRARVASI